MQKGKEKFETLRGRLVHQFLRVFTLIRLSWLSLLLIINITQILLSNRCSTGLPFCFELSQISFTLLKQLDFLVRRVSSLKAQCRVASKILKNRLYLTNAQTIDCCAKVHNSETGYSPSSLPLFSFCSKTSSQILVELCRLVFLKRTLFQTKTCHFPSRFHT